MTFAAEVDAADLEDRRRAVECIKPLYDLKRQKADYEKAEKQFDPSASDYSKMGALRRYLTDHPLPEQRGNVIAELYDEELGLVAYLQGGGESDVYDTPNAISNRAPDVFLRLMELDCLSVDKDAVQNALKKGLLMEADIAPFRHKISRTPSLRIEERKP